MNEFEWFEWFGPSPIEPFNSDLGRGHGLEERHGVVHRVEEDAVGAGVDDREVAILVGDVQRDGAVGRGADASVFRHAADGVGEGHAAAPRVPANLD